MVSYYWLASVTKEHMYLTFEIVGLVGAWKGGGKWSLRGGVDTREGFGWKIMDFWLQPLLCPSANPLDVKL